MRYETLYTREELTSRTAELGAQLREDAGDRTILLLGVLKGALPFLADLLRATPGSVRIDTLETSSYVGTESSGTVAVTRLPSITDFSAYYTVLVEDIVDTGRTISVLVPWVRQHGATEVHICTMLDKPSRRVNDVKPEYVGFTIEDRFVIGYGLDLDEEYRNLDFVAEVVQLP